LDTNAKIALVKLTTKMVSSDFSQVSSSTPFIPKGKSALSTTVINRNPKMPDLVDLDEFESQKGNKPRLCRSLGHRDQKNCFGDPFPEFNPGNFPLL